MERIKTAILLGAVFLSTGATVAADFDHSHRPFGQVIGRFVANALVDYAALKEEPAALNAYLEQLAAVPESQFNEWTDAQQTAFLINAYNAYTLRLVIDHYPIRSIRRIGSVLRGPFDLRVVKLFGKTFSLNDIEHTMLRKKYREPRLHFALVCASLGCPPLRNEPYTGDQLEAQLEDQARIFLADREKNYVDVKARVVYLSPIFRWYDDEFEEKAGSVLKFVQPYFPAPDSEALRHGKFRIRYTKYDWSLNSAEALNR